MGVSDWLRLSYEVTLSSFGARMSLASPPPVLENSLAGIVRVPADHMVVLGGLVGQDNSTLVDKVPFLGDIPILGELFKRRSSDGLNETLFVFVRPTILRDERFRDLINLSRADIETANVAFKDWPKNPLMQYPASKEEAKSR